jgi:hypothetical protein
VGRRVGETVGLGTGSTRKSFVRRLRVIHADSSALMLWYLPETTGTLAVIPFLDDFDPPFPFLELFLDFLLGREEMYSKSEDAYSWFRVLVSVLAISVTSAAAFLSKASTFKFLKLLILVPLDSPAKTDDSHEALRRRYR